MAGDDWKNSIPHTWILQNQVWMIEFSYKYHSMFHNTWLDIPYVFLLFIKIISDKHTWRRLIRFTYGRELVVHWAGPFLLYFLCSIRIVAWSSPINPSLICVDSWLMGWSSLEMWTQVPPWLSSGMAESCSSLFVSDSPTVLMVKEGTSLVLVWKLHLNDLGMLSCDHGCNTRF